MANVSTLVNSSSPYEQLIRQVISVEAQPRFQLVARKTDQGVYKGILSDFNSKASALNALVGTLKDPLQSPFSARAARVTAGAGFSATATDTASTGDHEVRVRQLARADARLSRRTDPTGTALAARFSDGGDPPAPAERRFTIHVAQPTGDPVSLDVRYTPPDGATDGDVLDGIAAAVTAATAQARSDGRLADGTGVSASVVRETGGASRLSLRSSATGFGGRLTFDDPDGLLGALELDRTAVRTGDGGGAVYAVGTGVEDSGLSAAFDLDGLTLYRDRNTVSDALSGVTLTLTAPAAEAGTLSVGADTGKMREQIDAFISAYNGLASFLASKSAVDADTGVRGAFAGDAATSGLRFGLRADLVRDVPGRSVTLAQIGITASRDGTLSVSDAGALADALSRRPADVGALFGGDDGLGARLGTRLGDLLGADGTIAARKKNADSRIAQLGSQISRWDSRLQRREDTLRAQFNQLQAVADRASAQQQSLAGYLNYNYSSF